MLPTSIRSLPNDYKGDKLRLTNRSITSSVKFTLSEFLKSRNRVKISLILFTTLFVYYFHSSFSSTRIYTKETIPNLSSTTRTRSSSSKKSKLIPINLPKIDTSSGTRKKVKNKLHFANSKELKQDSLPWPSQWKLKGEDWEGKQWLSEKAYLKNLNLGLLHENDVNIPPDTYVKQAMNFVRMENLEDRDNFELDGRPRMIKHEDIFMGTESERRKLEEETIKMGDVQKGIGLKPMKKIQLEKGWDNKKDKLIEEKNRREWVKRAFMHTWTGYKTYAWGHDELKPSTNGFSDNYNGWGATILDTLDTLLIMDLPDQYNLARQHVSDLDFTYLVPSSLNAFKNTLPRLEIWNPIERKSMHLVHTFSSPKTIPTFETIIRYLGGLLSAYDLSHDELMLSRATELADWILPALGTSYGLAKGRYSFGKNLNGTFAGPTSLAEVGTLSLEFTRLSMLTGIEIYYQAVKRTTQTLDTEFLPADLPPTESELADQAELDQEAVLRTEARQADLPAPAHDLLPLIEDEPNENDSIEIELGKKERRDKAIIERERKRVLHEVKKRPSGRLGKLLPCKVDPEARSLAGVYSFGGEADSYYEYLIKEYQLLGDSDEMFGRMYKESIDSAYEYLITKIDIVPEKNDMMMFGVNYYGRYKPEMEHLACFTGGMMGMGARLLSRDEDMVTALAVTDACVWAYESSASGLGPESLSFVPAGTDMTGRVKDEASKFNFLSYASSRDLKNGLPAGVATANPKHIGRPETIESVFYMYRLTGDRVWQDRGWNMFTAWVSAGLTESGFASVNNVYAETTRQGDSMESFVLAETLKYYYLLFSPPDLISLDDFVFNTEAHPFRIPKPKSAGAGPKITWKDPGEIFSKKFQGQGTEVQKWARIQQIAVLSRVNY